MKAITRCFRNGNVGYLFVLPAAIYMLLLVGYPIASNIVLGFQDVTVMTLSRPDKPFVGLANYATLLADPVLRSALLNTFTFTIGCLALQFTIGFVLALFFNRDFPGAKPIRGIMMIPWMVPMTVTALIFKFMFSSNVGIINQALLATGLVERPIEWLLVPGTARAALIFANTWIGIPFNMILLSAGLTTIPKELMEAASIDGATKAQTFRKITIPMLKPVIESVLILGFIYTFKVFDLVFVMTGGGPVNSTHLLSTLSYKLSFSLFKYSQGAAVANMLFVILLTVSILYLRFAYDDKEAD
jgi:multiple sugar transport system permease protein